MDMRPPSDDAPTRAEIDQYAERTRQELCRVLADPGIPWFEKRTALAYASGALLREPDLPRRADGTLSVADVIRTRTDEQWVQLAEQLCPGALRPAPELPAA